jgi:cell division protein ZapA (FtsZ GTPase activity inhibitor)
MRDKDADNRESIYRRFSSGKPGNEKKIPASPRNVAAMPEYRQIRRDEGVVSSRFDTEKSTRVTVHIAGMQYRLIANDHEQEAYIREIATKAEQLIQHVQSSMPGLPMTSLTVLSLVNALDESSKYETEILELKDKLETFHQSQLKMRENYTHLREINWELKKEVLRLQAVIEEAEKQGREGSQDQQEKELLPLEELVFDYLAETEQLDVQDDLDDQDDEGDYV